MIMRALLPRCGALALSALIVTGCSDDNVSGPMLPRMPSNPSPANGDSIFMTSIYLKWDCSHPDGKVLSYDIYIDTISPPRIFRTHHWTDSLLVAELNRGSTYFWKIVAADENYNTTSAPTWQFAVGPPRDFPRQ